MKQHGKSMIVGMLSIVGSNLYTSEPKLVVDYRRVTTTVLGLGALYQFASKARQLGSHAYTLTTHGSQLAALQQAVQQHTNQFKEFESRTPISSEQLPALQQYMAKINACVQQNEQTAKRVDEQLAKQDEEILKWATAQTQANLDIARHESALTKLQQEIIANNKKLVGYGGTVAELHTTAANLNKDVVALQTGFGLRISTLDARMNEINKALYPTRERDIMKEVRQALRDLYGNDTQIGLLKIVGQTKQQRAHTLLERVDCLEDSVAQLKKLMDPSGTTVIPAKKCQELQQAAAKSREETKEEKEPTIKQEQSSS